MDFEDTDHAEEILAELNRQRKDTPGLCDVKLCVQGDHIPAHRAVLAACSAYFKARFSGHFDDCRDSVCVLPDCSVSVGSSVIEYLYSGKIRILHEEVHEVLSIADYFCLGRLKTHCVQFMRANVSEDNCLLMKYLAERFSLKDLSKELSDYIAPRFSRILTNAEATMELTFDFLKYLFLDPNFNHVNEQQIYNFWMQWIRHDLVNRKQYIKDVLSCVEINYLPQSFVREHISRTESSRALLDNESLEELTNRLEQTVDGRSVEIIVCRSRSVTIGQEVKLLCYLPHDDTWQVMATPEKHMLDGLESLVKHLDSLYFLVSRTEDMYGYMHHTHETKYLWRLNLATCTWEQLRAPTLVRGNCRLLSHVNGVYVIDRSGLVEEFDDFSGHWAALSERGYFENANSTWYVLPMAFDRYLYVLRVFSAGFAFCYGQLSFSLHRIDTVRRECELLSEIDSCDLDIGDNEKLHGYVATGDDLIISNELGQPRLKFSVSDKQWSTLTPNRAIPNFITDVWGSAKAASKIYFVGKSKIESPIVMMYDPVRDRFKATVAPPTYLSGLMCQATLPTTSWQKITRT